MLVIEYEMLISTYNGVGIFYAYVSKNQQILIKIIYALDYLDIKLVIKRNLKGWSLMKILWMSRGMGICERCRDLDKHALKSSCHVWCYVPSVLFIR